MVLLHVLWLLASAPMRDIPGAFAVRGTQRPARKVELEAYGVRNTYSFNWYAGRSHPLNTSAKK